MKKIIINAYGADKPGLVSKISKIINSHKGNIEVSKMSLLESDFTLLMLIKIPKNNIRDLFKSLNKLSDLVVSGKMTETNKTISKNFIKYIFKINTADNVGIIFVFSNFFKKNGLNIINMETHIENAPITGMPLFVLDSILMIPKDIDFKNFKKKLNEIADENNIEYELNKR